MAAEKRHDGAAVFGHGNDRRLGPLIAKRGRQHADESARRADPDNRRAAREQKTRMGGKRVEFRVNAVHPSGRPMDRGAVEPISDALGGGKPAGAEDQDHRRGPHRQASPRWCTSTIEK